MRRRGIVAATFLISIAALGLSLSTARADGDVHKVKHVIIIVQENHSFDNYLGALPSVPAGPYPAAACKNSDHRCLDGLTSTVDNMRNYTCANSNLDQNGNVITSF